MLLTGNREQQQQQNNSRYLLFQGIRSARKEQALAPPRRPSARRETHAYCRDNYEENMIGYIRPLDAEADGADWLEAALLVLETETRPQCVAKPSIAGQVDDREWLPAAPLPWRSLTKCRRGLDLIFRLSPIDAESLRIETR
jgi:hypothetical protein